MTVVQALFRDLLPGETRKGILRKAAKGLANKSYLTCDPKLHLTLSSMMVLRASVAPLRLCRQRVGLITSPGGERPWGLRAASRRGIVVDVYAAAVARS